MADITIWSVAISKKLFFLHMTSEQIFRSKHVYSSTAVSIITDFICNLQPVAIIFLALDILPLREESSEWHRYGLFLFGHSYFIKISSPENPFDILCLNILSYHEYKFLLWGCLSFLLFPRGLNCGKEEYVRRKILNEKIVSKERSYLWKLSS